MTDTTDMTAEPLDYKDTLFLPKTDFPMRAGLPQREPDWLARWQRLRIYDRLRETAHGRPPFGFGARWGSRGCTRAHMASSSCCSRRRLGMTDLRVRRHRGQAGRVTSTRLVK